MTRPVEAHPVYVIGRRAEDGSSLVAFQEEITRETLASHTTGYSTTKRDLVHDLLPF